MNLLTLMPKLNPKFIQELAQTKQIPIGSVPLLKLEDALTILGYDPSQERMVQYRNCECSLCQTGGRVLVEAWNKQNGNTPNNPGSV